MLLVNRSNVSSVSLQPPLSPLPAHPLLATLSSHPLSTRRGSQISIFSSFRVRNNSEADFGDDEYSVYGDVFRSRTSSTATPWKRRTGSVRSHCSQVFTPSLTVNGRLNVSLDQNGVTTVGLHTPTSMLGYSMERVREDTVSDESQGVNLTSSKSEICVSRTLKLNRSEWKALCAQ